MMFSGTFNQGFYKKLHSYTHKTLSGTRGLDALKGLLKNPLSINSSKLKTILKLPVYWILGWKEKLALSKMENVNKV